MPTIKSAIHKLNVTKRLANATATNAARAIDDLQQSGGLAGGRRKRRSGKKGKKCSK
jgi:hypothetical protein